MLQNTICHRSANEECSESSSCCHNYYSLATPHATTQHVNKTQRKRWWSCSLAESHELIHQKQGLLDCWVWVMPYIAVHRKKVQMTLSPFSLGWKTTVQDFVREHCCFEASIFLLVLAFNIWKSVWYTKLLTLKSRWCMAPNQLISSYWCFSASGPQCMFE